MSANVGLELLFQTAVPQLVEKPDVLIVFMHWKLIANGWKCTGLKEQDSGSSELLPPDWNQNHDVYDLYYSRAGKKYLLKAVRVDQQIIINLARLDDNVTSSLSLEIDTHVSDDFRVFGKVFVDKRLLSDTIDNTLLQQFLKTASQSQAANPPPQKQQPSHDPLRVGEPRRPGRGYYNEWPYEQNPFAVGGGDLDPFGRGMGGGMLMDPRHQRYPGSLGPPFGVPPNLPRGSVPPGARFDPFGPPRPDFIPPPPGAGTGGFGDPDPDHLPPPSGSDDMFM